MDKTAVITTTINVPEFLSQLCENEVSYRHEPAFVIKGGTIVLIEIDQRRWIWIQFV